MRSQRMALGSLVMVAGMMVSGCAPAAPQIVEKVVTQVVERSVEKISTQIVEKQVERVVTATPVPPTAVPTAVPARETDTVVLAIQQEPDTLHPLIGSAPARSYVLSALMPGCMAQNEKDEWVALGCESVPTIENGGAKMVGEGADQHLEVTYKIKRGWRWTDGAPVTSKDAVYTWKLAMDPEFEIADRSAQEMIYELAAVDDSTFITRFMSEAQARQAAAGTLKGAVAFDKYREDYIASAYDQQTGPVVDPTYWLAGLPGNVPGTWLPEHILGKIPAKDHASSDWAKMPVGDGAYVVKEWKQGQEIDLEKSDKPFILGDAKIKSIVWRFYGDSSAVIAALQKGEVDAAIGNVAGLGSNNAPDLDKIAAAGKYKVDWKAGLAWEHIDLNTTRFPLDDVKVRQALAYATDKQGLVDRLYYGKMATSDSPLPPISWAYTDSYNKYPFDMDKARALLKEAGWDCSALPCTKQYGGETRPLKITLMTTDRADRVALAQVIQQQWMKINVGVDLNFLYGRGLFAPCQEGGPLSCRTFDAAIYTWWPTGDGATFVATYSCQAINTKENDWAGQNYPGFCDNAADQLLHTSELDVNTALSREKRKPLIAEFFKIWTAQMPVIPLFAATEPYVSRTGFKNFKPGPTKPGPTQYAGPAWNAWEWELSK